MNICYKEIHMHKEYKNSNKKNDLGGYSLIHKQKVMRFTTKQTWRAERSKNRKKPYRPSQHSLTRNS